MSPWDKFKDKEFNDIVCLKEGRRIREGMYQRLS